MVCYTRKTEDSNRHVKVTLERLPESRVQLDIEVDSDRLEQSIDAAYKRMAGKARVPGFRPGKAPRPVIERLIGGRPGLIREALDTLVPDVYNEAIAAEDVDAIAQPELEIVEFDPVRFKAIVPVRPTVDLGDYHSIRVVQEGIEVTDEALAEQLLLLRRRHAVLAPVERPAQYNDVLTASVTGKVDEDDVFVKDEDAEFALREGKELLVPGLTEAFIGMSKGEEKVIELPIAEDFGVERLAGKTATFTISLSEVKEEQLPEEDDDLAQQVNADDFPTWDSLVERVKNDLHEALKNQAEAKLQQEAVDKLLEGATLEYPKVLVDREIDHMINDALRGDQANYRAYLQQVGRSEEEFRETFREAAETRVRRSLVLSQLAEQEGLDVGTEEIVAEIESLAAPMGEEAQRFVEMFSSPEGISTIRRNLLSRKTLERMQAIARGESGDAPAAAEEPAPETSEEPA